MQGLKKHRLRPLALAALAIGTFVVAPPDLRAQDPAPGTAPAADAAAPAEAFSEDQLKQMAAPIALYPDSLLAQILMAATYPLEIVQADRWRKANPKLEGDALATALKEKEWDESVKSLCTFPTVLQRMSENLDWTQDVGDAFLDQREQFMAAVQTVRKKAHDDGKLESTEQQKVVVEKETIVIQPSNPEVIYVPSYPPAYVYPAPSYYYPAMYPAYPPGAAFWSFTAGVVVGGAIWGNCNWGSNDVDIDIDNSNNFSNKNNSNNQNNKNKNKNQGNTNKNGKGKFNHDPSHRQGVNYKNKGTAQKYGAQGGSNRVSNDAARGRSSAPKASTNPSKPGGGAGGGARPSTGASKPSTSNRGGGGNSALGGSKNAGMDKAASSRGGQSRGSSGAKSSGGSRSSGGGSRGGGGGSRGGGGGGGGGRRR